MTFALLLVCFFLSGFSALLYETAWTREFAFVFGTSELAVVAVLAAYMGGLALGAAVAARIAPRIRRPVLAYGVLELGIALWAIALPVAIRAVSALYLGWLGGLDAVPETLGIATHAFHLAGAFAVLVPCTALMGATLPLLASHAVVRDEQIGPRVGLLYAANTTGAIAGTITAAFVLLPALGLRHTVHFGAAVNVLVFAAAAALARRAPPGNAVAPKPARGVPWILPAIAISGAVSFSYEVLWFRLLGQLLGGSTAAFSTMLASFLLGIALGSALAARYATTPHAAARGFAAAQLGTGAFAWLAFCAADRLRDAANALGASVNALAPGALVAVAMLLPLTLCVGATFPFAVRLLARDARDASPASARVYAWNTLGSIAGAVGTGYFLLPWRGFVGTLVAAALLNFALAFSASVLARPVRRALAATAVAAALLLAVFPTPRPDRLLRASPLGGDYPGTFTYLGVGRSSTAALIDQGMGWRLTNNGLPESYVRPVGYPPSPTAAEWLSLLPVLVRPDTAHMLIIGLGAGMTLAAVPSTVETIDVIELEPEVVAANRSVSERAGGDPLADPRLTLRLGDARGALILANRRFDAIVSQPSHPWTAGASHLYTREFFSLVHSRLSPEGVFVQWIGAAFVDPERLRSLLAAQNEVFANVQVYLPEGGAIVLVCSDAPIDVLASAARAITRAPQDFATSGIHRVEDVVAALALDADGARALAAGARANTDDRNQFATSDRPTFANVRKGWLDAALAPYDPLPGLVQHVDVARVLLGLRLNNNGARARRIAAALDSPRRELALGWIELEAHRPQLAAEHFTAALAADPALTDAAIGLASVDTNTPLAKLPDRARAVIETARQETRDEHWAAGARARDALLAQWQPGEPLYLEAVEQRLRWRIELGDRADLEPGLAIVDTVLTRAQLPRFLLYRAEIAARLERPELAWLSLHSLAADSNMRPAPQIAQRALALARELGEPPLPAIRVGLEQFAQRGSGAMMREAAARERL
jgi:spermidine synthase